MRTWLVALVAVFALGASPAAAQKALSPAEFRDAVIAVVRAQRPDATIEITGELSFHVAAPDPSGGENDIEMTANLDRGYQEYTWDPSALDEVAARWARFAASPPENANMPERVVGIMRTQSHVVGFLEVMATADEPATLVWRPIAGDVVEMMAFDSAEAVQFATEQALADIDLTPESAWAMTVGNLPARLGPIDNETIAEGLEVFSGGNGLAPSVLLNPSFCAAQDSQHFSYLLVDRDAYARGDRRLGGDVLLRVVRDGLVRDREAFSTTILVCAGGRLQEERF